MRRNSLSIHCLWAAGALASLLAVPGPVLALNLQLNVSNLQSNTTVSKDDIIYGVAYNASAEGSLTISNLQAFYLRPLGRDPAGQTFPASNDVPQAGQLPFGSNSEFAAQPTSDANWWITDSTTFRSNWGIPTNGFTNVRLPPYILRNMINQTNTAADDKVVPYNGDNFTIRMEGKIVLPSNGLYRVSGSGDDVVRIWVDGYAAFNQYSYAPTNGWWYLKAGAHGLTVDFIEFTGAQSYSFTIPGGSYLQANGQNEHTYAGRTLEYGRVFTEQRPARLTAYFRQGDMGTGTNLYLSTGTNFYYLDGSRGNYGNDIGPSPLQDNYRLYAAGYWYAPISGTYSFKGDADDRYGLAITNDPNANPWAIPLIMASNTNGVPLSPLTNVVYLDQGWVPVRFEFGEGGGNASWNIYWSTNALTNSAYFTPETLKSTADPVYDWTLATADPSPVPANGVLFALQLPNELVGRYVDLRIRAVGTDLSYAEKVFAHMRIVTRGTLILLR